MEIDELVASGFSQRFTLIARNPFWQKNGGKKYETDAKRMTLIATL